VELCVLFLVAGGGKPFGLDFATKKDVFLSSYFPNQSVNLKNRPVFANAKRKKPHRKAVKNNQY
jgi:hypothetical protein